MYIYVHIYTCIYVCIHMYTHIYIYTHIDSVHIYNVQIYTHIHRERDTHTILKLECMHKATVVSI